MTDLQTFALAFGIVWLGLAAYFVRLHALARRLEAATLRRPKP